MKTPPTFEYEPVPPLYAVRKTRSFAHDMMTDSLDEAIEFLLQVPDADYRQITDHRGITVFLSLFGTSKIAVAAMFEAMERFAQPDDHDTLTLLMQELSMRVRYPEVP